MTAGCSAVIRVFGFAFVRSAFRVCGVCLRVGDRLPNILPPFRPRTFPRMSGIFLCERRFSCRDGNGGGSVAEILFAGAESKKRFASAGKVFLHRHRARKQSAGGGVRCETFTGCEQHTSAGKVFCTGTERVGVSAQRFFRRCIFRGYGNNAGKGQISARRFSF